MAGEGADTVKAVGLATARSMMQGEVTESAMFMVAWPIWYHRVDGLVAPASGVQEALVRQAIRSAVLAEGRSGFVKEIALMSKSLALRFSVVDPSTLGYATDEVESLVQEDLAERRWAG